MRSKDIFMPKRKTRKITFLVPDDPIPAGYRKLIDKYQESQERIMMRGVRWTNQN